jgi:peptidoglycan/LPS O-acetylase OafA/YrhL
MKSATGQGKATEKAIFFPNLDGLRFFCFLSVFLYHSGYTEVASIRDSPSYRFVKRRLFGNLNLGVNFFFVLSGFLITYLLLEERRQTDGIDIRSFYVRRILRIWPLYYFCVIFGFVVFPAIKLAFGLQPEETATPFFYLMFLGNFDFIRHGLPDASVLGILWSVAVEEQFYLVWPLLLLSTAGTAAARFLFPAVVAASWVYRATHLDDPLRLEIHTLSVVSDMAVGGWVAQASLSGSKLVERIRKLRHTQIGAIYGAVLVVLLFRHEIFESMLLRSVDRLVVSGLFALVILEQNYSERSLFKLGRSRTLSRLGMYTYGLYCLHPIAILVVLRATIFLHSNTSLWQILVLEPSLSLALCILLAYTSYASLERPFLRLKGRFQRVTSGGPI